MKKIALWLINLYQRSWSFRKQVFKTLFLSDATCRFRPTCSQYTYQAISKYGIMRGGWLGLRRIIRCHPWSKGGEDLLR